MIYDGKNIKINSSFGDSIPEKHIGEGIESGFTVKLIPETPTAQAFNGKPFVVTKEGRIVDPETGVVVGSCDSGSFTKEAGK